MQQQTTKTIDYRRANAANLLLPQPSILASSGWQQIHLEIFEQPKFEIAEHQHTMHVLACGLPEHGTEGKSSDAAGERWLDGKRKIETRDRGNIAIIPANIFHRCNWNNSVRFMVLAIEPALLERVGRDWVDPDRIELIPQFMTDRDELIQGIFSTLKAELETGGIGGDLLIDSLRTTLAIHLIRNYCTTDPKLSISRTGLSPAKLTLITDYINEHLQQDLRLEEIAALAHMSQYHFLRAFARSMGITPHQYILQRRIERAKYLLQHSQLSIADIAISVGFCDQSHLNRSFKRMVGVPPTQFIKNCKQ